MPLSRAILLSSAFLIILLLQSFVVQAQDYDDTAADTPTLPAQDSCNGVFLTYTFISREKEYPHVKNATAQSYAFKSIATVLNTMTEEVKTWKMFVGFQHKEILVSASGAVLIDGTDFPANVENGTTFAGYPQADLMTAIETAGDINQIQVRIELSGTQFGVRAPGIPMPKTIKLVNDGIKCPAPTKKGSMMYVCCVKDKKAKKKALNTNNFLPRMKGDLTIAYDVLNSYQSNYLAQVTLDIHNPLARLDNWNITWEWKRGEFINTMRGAYTFKKGATDCLYGPQSTYYQGFDFSTAMNCERKPVITDLPPDRVDDPQVGKLPYCCKNGTLLSPIMDETRSKAIFQLQVYKMPPDLNRTALYPPANFKINGYLNSEFKCGPPIKVSPMQFPDPSGLMAKSYAVVSWQVSCNITKPVAKKGRCCVSFSAYYNDSVVPCNTCACGCPTDGTCNRNARALLLPSEALLVPGDNRTAKAKAWANIKHMHVPNPMPCWDNCGVSINWHINANYRDGWTARITLFNWADYTFRDWLTAIVIPKAAKGYENVYSFNGTTLPTVKDTIFFQGLPGLNYLMPEVDGEKPGSPRVPGKQQSVISFKKKHTPGIDIFAGDGFPTKVYFDGEECVLPVQKPSASGRTHVSIFVVVLAVFAALFV